MVTVVARGRPQSLVLAVESREPLVDDEKLRELIVRSVAPLRALDSCEVSVDDDDDDTLVLVAELEERPPGPELGGNDNFAFTTITATTQR